MDERSLKQANLVFRFILELLALVALFLWGTSVSGSLAIQLALGFGAPATAMAVWATFVAPRASRRLPDPPRLVVELGVWVAGTLAFGFAVSWVLAALFGLAVLVSLVLMFLWDQRGL